MANLATATSTNQAAVSTLTTTNATLTTEMSAATSNIEILQQRLAACTCTTNQLTPPNGSKYQGSDPLEPVMYCWTHGYVVSVSHNSGNCKYKAPGHKNTMMRASTMGGSTKNKPGELHEGKYPKIKLQHYSNLVTKSHNGPVFSLGTSTHSVADSGTTRHYITNTTPCVKKTRTRNPIIICIPNGETIR